MTVISPNGVGHRLSGAVAKPPQTATAMEVDVEPPPQGDDVDEGGGPEGPPGAFLKNPPGGVIPPPYFCASTPCASTEGGRS